jgi:SAM-dependent methyltransferase
MTKEDLKTGVKKHRKRKRLTPRLFYDFLYQYSKAPWDKGPRSELVELVNNNTLTPVRTIDLGCGTGSNAIFLAQHGFDVTGVDFASSAITKAREKAKSAGVDVNFVVDDFTDLSQIKGPFDLLVDYGAFDDLSPKNRRRYVETVLSLSHSETQFFLWTFEWKLLWWERFLVRLLPFAHMALELGEVNQYFGDYFKIKRISGAANLKGWPRGYASYLMARKEV